MAGLAETVLELAACLCRGVEEAEGPDVCFCGVLPGETVTLDYCNECSNGLCGMAWVRMINRFPSQTLPTPDETLRSCVSPMAVLVEVGIVRCAPTEGPEGGPPTVSQWLDVSLQQYADADIMRIALQCCLGTKDWVLGSYAPVGPQGGCVGGTWQATFAEMR